MPFRHLALLLAVGSLFGCAATPPYVEPDVPLPSRYASQKVVDPQRVEATDLSRWWKGFNDPTLTRFITIALERNLDLAQATARVAQARAGLGAADAALLPSASLSGQASRAYQSIETPLGQVLNAQPGFNRYGNAYEANLQASWEMDVFGGLRQERAAALADYQATEAAATAVGLVVAAQTADIYITVRGLQARLEVARRQVRTRQELLAHISRLHHHGLAAELQLRQAEGALARVQASLPVLQTGLDAAMNALDVVLGVPPGTYRTELDDASPIPAAPQITTMGAPSDLLRRRPDLIMAERRLAASNARIAAAMAEYYPKFSLGGLLGSATSLSSGNLFSGSANQSAGVLGLRWRLFDFARIDAQIEEAEGRETELLAAYRMAVLRATEDVESAFSALINRKEQAVVLAQGEDSLGRARDASFAAYQRGVVSLIEVLNADENLLEVSDALVVAHAESARAAVGTFKALGGGWQPDSRLIAEVGHTDGQ